MNQKCRIKGVSQLPLWFSLQFFTRIVQTMYKEKAHKPLLVDLAKHTTAQVWGVPTEKLDGAITQAVSFGRTRIPSTFRGLILRTGAAGYCGVLNDGSELKIVGKGWVWPILLHKLVKATCELICMHGLNKLDQSTYEKVVDVADRIEFEPWMLQVGPELWRRILALLPHDRPIAEMMMHMARLPALSLEELMFDIVENEPLGRLRLANLGKQSDPG